MERVALIAESVLTSREFAEVARGLRTYIIVEFEDDSSGGLGVNSDVKLRMRRRQRQEEEGGGGGKNVRIRYCGEGKRDYQLGKRSE